MPHLNGRQQRNKYHSYLKYSVIVQLVLMVLSYPLSAPADDMVLEVIPLHHRTAEELVPQIKDFVDKDGTIKAANNKLIVRSHPANIKDLRNLVTKLDVPLRRLSITVKQLSGEAARDAYASIDAQAADNGRHSRSVRAWQTDARDNANRIQRIQVTEDGQALIDVGRQIPISDFAFSQSRSGTLMEQKTRYVGATTGFYVRPHLNGDTVSVEIMPYQTTRSGLSTPPKFNTQSLHTTISGKLGEWIVVGASFSDITDDNQNTIEYSTSQHGEQDRLILMRVTTTP